jgi:N-acylglucosamine-6-phosphate 2-epimerase
MSDTRFSITFRRGLIVSCQALKHEPLYGSAHMAAMARAAQMGGAIGIRANSPEDIGAIKQAVSIPVIGLYKITQHNSEVEITPTVEAAEAIARAGADAIALDATARRRPAQKTAPELMHEVKAAINLPVVADISTFEEAVAAVEAAADAIATTLAGYTPYSSATAGPDLELIKRLVKATNVPVLAEGRYTTPEEAVRALELGAYAVVVGGAITRPQLITARFVERIRTVLEGRLPPDSGSSSPKQCGK